MISDNDFVNIQQIVCLLINIVTISKVRSQFDHKLCLMYINCVLFTGAFVKT